MARQRDLTETWADPARRALLGLWSIPGVGAAGLAELTAAHPPESLAGVPAKELPRDGGGQVAAEFLLGRGFPTLDAVAEQTLERCHLTATRLCFPGDAAFPDELTRLPQMPPVLFYVGRGGSAYRRVAMVGTREATTETLQVAAAMAQQLAAAGLTVVSGGARGVDQACHGGAIRAGGETWAFLGCGPDQVDGGQRRMFATMVEAGGTLYSEYPPGVRSQKEHFPLRNRLISGASEAVVVFQASLISGALHTARYAIAQGRRLLVLAAHPTDEASWGGLAFAEKGQAELVVSAAQVLRLMGVAPSEPRRREGAPDATPDLSELSPQAVQAYEVMSRKPQPFDEVLRASGVDSGALVSALCELELSGLVVQRPGKFYERI